MRLLRGKQGTQSTTLGAFRAVSFALPTRVAGFELGSLAFQHQRHTFALIHLLSSICSHPNPVLRFGCMLCADRGSWRSRSYRT